LNKLVLPALVLVILGAGFSVYALSGETNASVGGQTPGAIYAHTYSYPRNSAGGIIQHVNASNGFLDGCYILAKEVPNQQGYTSST
jgi:hypothetical protein